MQNIQKWVHFSFLLASALTWLVLRQLTTMVFQLVGWRPAGDWAISPADWVGLAAGVVVFVVFSRYEKINIFVRDSLSELAKVVWPPRKESVLSTGVVAVMVGIVSLILFGFDSLWGTVVGVLYK